MSEKNGFVKLDIDLLDAEGEIRPLEEIEREVIIRAMVFYDGQMSEVARRLGIGRATLYRKADDNLRTSAGKIRSQLKNGLALAKVVAEKRGYQLHPKLATKAEPS